MIIRFIQIIRGNSTSFTRTPEPLDILCEIWYILAMKTDLHIHSNFSDGIFTPEALVDMAKARGLDCIAITDHDTFEGVARAKKHAEEVGLKYVVGAELSSIFDDREVHVLVYNVDTSSDEFKQTIAKIADLRNQRNVAIVAKLAEHGFEIDLDELKKSCTSVGRGVIAREMIKKGYCSSNAEVFEKYLGVNGSCFVQTKRLTPTEVIQFALRFGGIAVLAHPKKLRMSPDEFERFLQPLVKVGLAGIEANYFTHTISERNYYGRLAKKHKLIATGGSDFHDYVHGVELGTKSFSPNGYTRTILGI